MEKLYVFDLNGVRLYEVTPDKFDGVFLEFDGQIISSDDNLFMTEKECEGFKQALTNLGKDLSDIDDVYDNREYRNTVTLVVGYTGDPAKDLIEVALS